MIFSEVMVLGPKAHEAHGTLLFVVICWKVVLRSGTYLEVFLGCLGVQGTP